MWINKIQGTIEVKNIKNLDTITDITVKLLQDNRFITDRQANRINFRRSVQFTTDTGFNKRQFGQYSYNGGIIIAESTGRVLNQFFLNINGQLFKLLLLGMCIGVFLYLFEIKINPFLYIGLIIVLILIQRSLIYDHFYNIIARLPHLVIDETNDSETY